MPQVTEIVTKRFNFFVLSPPPINFALAPPLQTNNSKYCRENKGMHFLSRQIDHRINMLLVQREVKNRIIFKFT